MCKNESAENSRINRIRESEARSHTEIYTKEKLYETDTWLKKPVKTVVELMNAFSDHYGLRVLDLGCGIGRNSIFIAETFKGRECMIDCVDILEKAVQILEKNAVEHGVKNRINGTVKAVEEYDIAKNTYDLILAVSALEHIDTEEHFIEKLNEIRNGVREGGIVCLIINSEVTETDIETNEALEPAFEVNLPTERVLEYLEDAFCGWHILRQNVVSEEYSIPRDGRISRLTSKVITFVAEYCIEYF